MATKIGTSLVDLNNGQEVQSWLAFPGTFTTPSGEVRTGAIEGCAVDTHYLLCGRYSVVDPPSQYATVVSETSVKFDGNQVNVTRTYQDHAPPPPTPAQLLANGIAITSTGTPALNATYPLDQTTQDNIDAVIGYMLVNNNTFPPGKASTIQFPDAKGTMHTFISAAQFNAFATACADIVTQIKQGGSPKQAATIP